jgi:hypothetical protein
MFTLVAVRISDPTICSTFLGLLHAGRRTDRRYSFTDFTLPLSTVALAEALCDFIGAIMDHWFVLQL